MVNPAGYASVANYKKALTLIAVNDNCLFMGTRYK